MTFFSLDDLIAVMVVVVTRCGSRGRSCWAYPSCYLPRNAYVNVNPVLSLRRWHGVLSLTMVSFTCLIAVVVVVLIRCGSLGRSCLACPSR
jgi:hypothetical protein